MGELVAARNASVEVPFRACRAHKLMALRDAVTDLFDLFGGNAHGAANQRRRKHETDNAPDVKDSSLLSAEALELSLDHLGQAFRHSDIQLFQRDEEPNGRVFASNQAFTGHVVECGDKEQ